MLRKCIIITCFWWLTQDVSGTHRIAPGKFRFTDDIAYLKDGESANAKTDVTTEEDTVRQRLASPPENRQPSLYIELNKRGHDETENGTESHGDSASQTPERRTQSIGYTIESYPNPLKNPALCVQTTTVVQSFICDPDGILSDKQQEELNELLKKEGKYQVFVALAHSILMPEKPNDTQASFANQLLRSWGNEEVGSILLFYVEDLGELKVVTNVAQGVLTKENISDVEKTLLTCRSDVFEALKGAITLAETYLSHGGRSYLLVYLILVIMLLTVCAYVSHGKIKMY